MKNHESKYSHLPYRNLLYKNLPKAKRAFHIPHQIKIKVPIYITRDQTVAPWNHLGPFHFHEYHRIAILILTALKHITILHFVYVCLTFEIFRRFNTVTKILIYFNYRHYTLEMIRQKKTPNKISMMFGERAGHHLPAVILAYFGGGKKVSDPKFLRIGNRWVCTREAPLNSPW